MNPHFAPESMTEDLQAMQEIASRRKPLLRKLIMEIRKILPATVDQLVLRFAQAATSEISCTNCGNCCRNLEPAMLPKEALRLATHHQPDNPQEWMDIHTETETRGRFRIMRKAPCCLLSGMRCSVYAIRPASCADYPHLLSPGQKYRFRSTLQQYAICPIVFRTVEGLISELLPETHQTDC